MDSDWHKGTVYIVDDDALVRSSLEAMLISHGYEAQKFTSGLHFLNCVTPMHAGCLLADFRMPDIDGLELQAELARRQSPISVILLTGYADVSLAVRAIKSGVMDIVEKPYKQSQLLARIEAAIARSHEKLEQIRSREERLAKLNALTRREREVAEHLVAGRTNREIARVLGLSARTVEIHRAHVMEKLAVANLSELIREAGLTN